MTRLVRFPLGDQVDVHDWLEAFAAHLQIGQNPSSVAHKSSTSAQWSKGEQSAALATVTDSTLQELYELNSQYKQKFGFVFLICASGRSTPEILAELKKRFSNRPIILSAAYHKFSSQIVIKQILNLWYEFFSAH